MKKLNFTENTWSHNTEQKILNPSMRLFFEWGYHEISINHITQAVGITKGAIYWHLKDKEDFLKRIMLEFRT